MPSLQVWIPLSISAATLLGAMISVAAQLWRGYRRQLGYPDLAIESAQREPT